MAIQSQNFTIKNSILKIMLIFLKDNLVILKLITVYGIYFKFFHYKFIFFLIINTGQSVLLKNKIQNINKYTIFISFLIKHAYFLFYNARYYLKLKGLGFSIKYLIKPKHTLLFKLGFSKSRYIQIPKVISIIKKPRKKKHIFVFISINNDLLLNFSNTNIRKVKIPDPYKLKGFRYLQEAIKIKTGKKKK